MPSSACEEVTLDFVKPPTYDELCSKLVDLIEPIYEDLLRELVISALIDLKNNPRLVSDKWQTKQKISLLLRLIFIESRHHRSDSFAYYLRLFGKPEAAILVTRVTSCLTAVNENTERSHKAALDEAEITFIECFHPDREFLMSLHSQEVLSGEMVKKVLCRPNRVHRVKQLFEFLKALGCRSIRVFTEELRNSGQEFLANIITVRLFDKLSGDITPCLSYR